MYYKVEQVLEKQQAVTENFYKGRGILICETDCGLFALKEFRGQNPKAEYLFRLGSYLTEHHISCDFMIKNKEDQLITEGVDGTKYTFHHWMKGRECDAKSRMDLVMTVSFLAGFHRVCEREKFRDELSAIGILQESRVPEGSIRGTEQESQNPKALGADAEAIQMIQKKSGKALSDERLLQSYPEPKTPDKGMADLRQGTELTNGLELRMESIPKPRTENTSESQTENTLESQTENTPELWMENAPETTYEEYLRRDRELRRIKKYITARKNKSNFELLYLQCFPEYIRQSEKVLQFLSEHQEIFDNHTMGVCHGDFNQHNVVVQSGGMALIHMEHAHDGAQVADLGNFLRKSLEKHAWSETLGLEMLREYDRVHSLNESDWLELYCRMSYPEKFWKIANRYYQSNKVLDSGLNYEKLKKELRQNEARGRFLEVLRRTRVDV